MHRRIYQTKMDSSSSLRSLRHLWIPVVRYLTKIPIIPGPMVRQKGLTRRLSPCSANMWPNIRQIWICLYRHRRMPLMRKGIIRWKRSRSEPCSCGFVTHQALPCPIRHSRYRYVDTARARLISQALFVESGCAPNMYGRNSVLHSRATSASLTSQFTATKSSYGANTYRLFTCLNSLGQLLHSPTSSARSYYRKPSGPFRIIPTMPDTVTIDKAGIKTQYRPTILPEHQTRPMRQTKLTRGTSQKRYMNLPPLNYHEMTKPTKPNILLKGSSTI